MPSQDDPTLCAAWTAAMESSFHRSWLVRLRPQYRCTRPCGPKPEGSPKISLSDRWLAALRKSFGQSGRRVRSFCDPYPAKAFPAAVRELLQDNQHSATNLLRLATQRVDIRSSVGTPFDGPATIQKSEVLGFRDIAQHLESFVSGMAFVALSDSLLADLCRRAWAQTNGVIGPQIRQRHRISRQRRGDVLLAGLFWGGR